MRKTLHRSRGSNARTRTRSRRYSQSTRLSRVHHDKFLSEMFSRTAIGWQARTMDYSEHANIHEDYLPR